MRRFLMSMALMLMVWADTVAQHPSPAAKRQVDSLLEIKEYSSGFDILSGISDECYDLKDRGEDQDCDWEWVKSRRALYLAYLEEPKLATDMYLGYLISRSGLPASYDADIPADGMAGLMKLVAKTKDPSMALAAMIMMHHSSGNPMAADPLSRQKILDKAVQLLGYRGRSTYYILSRNQLNQALLVNVYDILGGQIDDREILARLAIYTAMLPDTHLRLGNVSTVSADSLFSMAVAFARKAGVDTEMDVVARQIKYLQQVNSHEKILRLAGEYIRKAKSDSLIAQREPFFQEQMAIACAELSMVSMAISSNNKAGIMYEERGDIERAALCYARNFDILSINNMDQTVAKYYQSKALDLTLRIMDSFSEVSWDVFTKLRILAVHYYKSIGDTASYLDFLLKSNRKKVADDMPKGRDADDYIYIQQIATAHLRALHSSRFELEYLMGNYQKGAEELLKSADALPFVTNDVIMAFADELLETQPAISERLYAVVMDRQAASPDKADKSVVSAYMGSASAKLARGDFAQAAAMYRKAEELLPVYCPKSNSLYPQLLNMKALAQYLSGDTSNIQPDMIKSFRLLKTATVNNFGFTSQNQFELMWESTNQSLSEILMMAQVVDNPTPEFLSMLYNSVVFQKNMFYLSQRSLSLVARESPENMETFNEIAAIRRTVDKNDGTVPRFVLDSLYNLSLEMERGLMMRSALFKRMRRQMEVSFSDISKSLRDGEIAVEFAKVQLYRPSVAKAAPQLCNYDYYAFVFSNQSSCPEVIRLFTEDELRSFRIQTPDYDYPLRAFLEGRNKYTISYTYLSKPLTDLIWGKILSRHAEANTIFFAPDGFLHTLGLEYLSLGDGKCMSDRYNMHRTSSTSRVVFRGADENRYSSMLLYGGIHYMPQDTAAFVRQNTDTTRLVRAFSFSGGAISYLPGTLSEAEAISDVFGSSIGNFVFYTGDDATEESFKQSAPMSDVIHVATHGKFLSDEALGITRSRDILEKGALVFAGSDRRFSAPHYLDDGFLTGLEISELDLSRNRLLVLSACETGLGHINSNGFFGLERAFKLAGCKSIVMSHWEISDHASYLIMKEFYKNMADGILPREALMKSINALRQNPKQEFHKPYYWAPFVIID